MTAPAASASPKPALLGLLAELLSFPGPTLDEAVRSGTAGRAVAHLVSRLPGPPVASLASLGPVDVDPGQLASEYIRLFDVPDGPPTPLYTGVYAARRRDAMEELLRFYRHFGLTLQAGTGDLPDAVPTVLEFLAYLAYRAEHEPAAATALADVSERHLLPWARETATRLKRRNAHPFYRSVVDLVVTVAHSR